LTAQLIPTSGELKVFGKDVYANKKYIFENVGILSDNSGIYERLSVFDNLKLFADIKGVPVRQVKELLEKVGLTEESGKLAKQLSKGMKQRLMIARAVLHRPKLLFMDEPTASLDPGTALEIHRLFRKLNAEGMTIFITTHNMEEADKLCDRVAFLNEGEIVEIGSPASLKLKYITDDISVVLKDSRDRNVTLKNDPKNASKIREWMENGSLLSIHSVEPSLEDIFLNITGRSL
jgi:ABC-2 type transport system ATP-binding protein